MGPIPSDGGGEDKYFLDLYITSHTPTPSALIHESDPAFQRAFAGRAIIS
ncbi:hypothetical protein EI94DRAFT_1801055 [Lactarius quietus]|nr:hypothetical protein EI94DRAFT_1801055 [Lactarius quietus]